MAKRAKSNPTTLMDRRTVIVLAALVASMTVVSAILVSLEPRPLGPVGGPVLTVLDQGPRGMDAVFATDPPVDPQRWQSIVIHHSGRSFGNANTIGRRHQRRGYEGLGHHFVIGNGDGANDGQIQIGYRWSEQRNGRHVTEADHAAWYNRHAISICLVGDGDKARPTQAQMDRLVRLVIELQRRLDIPADHVLLHSNIAETSDPGLLFPTSTFRQQLVAVD